MNKFRFMLIISALAINTQSIGAEKSTSTSEGPLRTFTYLKGKNGIYVDLSDYKNYAIDTINITYKDQKGRHHGWVAEATTDNCMKGKEHISYGQNVTCLKKTYNDSFNKKYNYEVSLSIKNKHGSLLLFPVKCTKKNDCKNISILDKKQAIK